MLSNSKSNENTTDGKEIPVTGTDNNSLETKNNTAVTLQGLPQENIDFKVIYNKQKIDVEFALDGTVAELKGYLQSIISVPQAMQKVMFKGLAKDDQTLRSMGVTKGHI